MSEGEPRLSSATLDAPCRITVHLTRRVHVAEWPASRFRLQTSDGQAIAVKSVYPCPGHDQTTIFVIETVEPLDFVHHQYEVRVEEKCCRLVSVRGVLQDPEVFGDPHAQMGCTYTPEASTFRVFAPTAAGVDVVVSDALEGDAGLVACEMHPYGKGIWEATIQGNLHGKFYAYRLRGAGFNPQREVGDIYATCAQGLHARTLILDMRRIDPPDFSTHSYTNPASPVDAVVYELHVRDFTISPDSNVTHKGKYLGLTETGTQLTGGTTAAPTPSVRPIVTGLDHLVELGITHVQLMPVQDFDNTELPDCPYDWGYMPVYFNSPEGWYASEAFGPSRITELKQAIQTFHEHGIGVILDVVYNHTAKFAPFERLVPHYYYRKTHTDHYFNGSGCGNEFMSESPMGRKFILDSLKMWVREYHIDGFRFDLMGLIDVETMRQIKAELTAVRPDILLWGEPWTGGHTPLKPIADKAQIRGLGIACFNDVFRDAIKGDRDGGPPGFVEVGDRIDGVKSGLAGAIHDWAAQPAECLNYFECHDNLTTWDKLLQSSGEAGEADLEKIARFAALLLLTTQGIVFLHAGQEFGRSKRGHHNSYNLPDSINQIYWKLKQRRHSLYEYYRGLIALRKAHPALRLRNRDEIEPRVWFGDVPGDRCIAYIIHSDGVPDEPSKAIVCLFNGQGHDMEFRLGEGTWSVHANASQAGLESLGTVQHSIVVPHHSGVLLCR